jgi:hypothetical protein
MKSLSAELVEIDRDHVTVNYKSKIWTISTQIKSRRKSLPSIRTRYIKQQKPCYYILFGFAVLFNFTSKQSTLKIIKYLKFNNPYSKT